MLYNKIDKLCIKIRFWRLYSLGNFKLSRDIAIDLGSSKTLVHVEDMGIVLREPSVVAIDKNTDKINCFIRVIIMGRALGFLGVFCGL